MALRAARGAFAGIWARIGRPVRAPLLAACVGLTSSPDAFPADVRTSLTLRDHWVQGSTAADLVRNLRAAPIAGDHGDALANLRARHTLAVTTQAGPRDCRIDAASIDIAFTLTLPRAADETALAPGARSAWRAFVAFAHRHELLHRDLYIACAREALAAMRRLRAPVCDGLPREAERLLAAHNAACDRRHAAFDRSDLPRLWSLSALRQADRAGPGTSPRAARP
jgi:predicted secreted Zn-dependent protease